jgi:hypothetical protein
MGYGREAYLANNILLIATSFKPLPIAFIDRLSYREA